MKKILEVLWYGENDVRFNTDIDVIKNPNVVLDINRDVLFSMITRLWGGNELSVLAMIRALAIADLAASVNTDEMVKMLSESAHYMKSIMQEARKEFEKRGGSIMTFAPGVKPSSSKS